MSRIITLTTDFGYRDWFVGSMKGVIKSIAPAADVIDVTHEIPPGDVRAASFVLAAVMPYYPKGTIHVAVVDPSVGTSRRAIAMKGKRSILVGPDNGVLTMPMEVDGPYATVELTKAKFFLEKVSRTFHGRDVFAPVAAHLARGVSLPRMGRPISGPRRLVGSRPTLNGGVWTGKILYVDRFGNAITNLAAAHAAGKSVRLEIGRLHVHGLSPFYGAGKPGRPIAVVNSLGLIEIAVKGGDAAGRFRLKPGQVVRLHPARTT